MKILSMKEYYEELSKFVNKHEVSRIVTSPFTNNEWYKDYLCEDGAVGKEINRVVYEQVEVEVKGLVCKVEVKLLETEWFDTDNGTSIYMYQRY
ncbi:MAG: hypothetical protein J6S85_20380 [Methanobrevibacter sp.]|nr:hypothetical protein [Methanobrevibacter sp.]